MTANNFKLMRNSIAFPYDNYKMSTIENLNNSQKFVGLLKIKSFCRGYFLKKIVYKITLKSY